MVLQIYGLQAGTKRTIKKQNEALVEKLLSESNFARLVCSPVFVTCYDAHSSLLQLAELDLPDGQRAQMYRSPAIEEFINKAFFKSPRALGIKYEGRFGQLMPKPTIAFALTMVSHPLHALIDR